MKYEFKLTATSSQLTLLPETNVERELFNNLFSSDVDVKGVASVNSTGEITISKKEKEVVKDPAPAEVNAT